MPQEPNAKAGPESLESVNAKIDEYIERLDNLESKIERFHRTVSESAHHTRHQLNSINSLLKATRDGLPSEITELLSLRRSLVSDNIEMPALGGWPLGSSTTVSICRGIQSGLYRDNILELGGGSSTVWIAESIKNSNFNGTLYSVDHDLHYLEKTTQMLKQRGLDEFVELIHAPLEDTNVFGKPARWYAASALSEVEQIGLLIIDGPPGTTFTQARLPAFYELAPNLTDDAWILLDDCNRSDEKAVLEKWLDHSNALSPVQQIGDTQILKFKRTKIF